MNQQLTDRMAELGYTEDPKMKVWHNQDGTITLHATRIIIRRPSGGTLTIDTVNTPVIQQAILANKEAARGPRA